MARRRRQHDGSDANLRLAPGVDAVRVAQFMEHEHGCEGVTMDARRGKVLGLRYRDDVASTHKEIDLANFTAPRRAPTRRRIYSFPSRGRK